MDRNAESGFYLPSIQMKIYSPVQTGFTKFGNVFLALCTKKALKRQVRRNDFGGNKE